MDSVQVLEHYGLIDEDSDISYNLQVKLYCPFHDENVQSLNFDLKNDIFFCFGCGAKGDLIDFVKRIEGINRIEAMKKVNAISEGEEEAKKEILEGLRNNNKDKEKLLERAKFYYSKLSRDCNECETYLLKRGISKKIIKKFGIKYNKHSQYPIIIPLFDESQFKGYIQRRIDGEEPKYLYNNGFDGKQTLVGKVRNDKPVLIVEGVIDLIKAYQHGYNNVVSILGWHASEYQLNKIKENADKVISALDNDRAGEKGNKILEEKLENVVILEYPEYVNDIGDLNQDIFRNLIEKSFKKFKK